MKRHLAVIFLYLIAAGAHGGDSPSGYFSNPLDSELVLKGTFGEIRPDHLHSGVDLSTGERTGLPVKAAADGYVSRIRISATGFGKAVYITHPNNTVTVYGHLQAFAPGIAEVASGEQLRLESFEIDFKPKPKSLKVKKGEMIAWSGNTGGSEGPHLHFEIRDEKSEEPLNPLLCCIKVHDTISPVIQSLRIFPKPMKGTVELTDKPESFPVVLKDGKYKVDYPGYIMAHGIVAFGIQATDYSNNSSAQLGLCNVTLTAGADTVYSMTVDRFNFSDTRAANGLVDYALLVDEDNTTYRCYRQPGLPTMGILKKVNTADGYMELTDEQAHTLVFHVGDAAGNVSELSVDILAAQAYGQVDYSYPPYGQILLSPFQGAAVHKLNSEIILEKGAVYDTCYLDVNESASNDARILSSIVTAGNPSVPLHTSMSVGLKANLPDSMLKSKALVVRIGTKLTSIGGQWNGDWLTANSRQCGRFGVALDTMAPVIKPLFDTAAATPDTMRFIIDDDLSGIQVYRAEVNGYWMLMEYDAKSRTLEGVLNKEQFNSPFILKVTDMKLNESQFTFFTKKAR